MTRYLYVRSPKRLTRRTAVTYVNSGKLRATTGAANFAVPSGAAAGDFAVWVITISDGGTLTAPADLTRITPTAGLRARNGGYFIMHMFVKFLVSGDIGANKTFTSSISSLQGSTVHLCSVYRNVGSYSVLRQHQSVDSEASSTNNQRFASIRTGPDDYVVGGISCSPAVDVTTSSGVYTTAPPGFTIRQTDYGTNGLANFVRGAAIMDRAGANGLPTAIWEFVGPANLPYHCSLLMALHPVNARHRETERTPASLTKPYRVFGYTHSMGALIPWYLTASTRRGYLADHSYIEKIRRAFGSHANSNNYSRPGCRAADICSFAFGTASHETQAVSGDEFVVNQTASWDVKGHTDSVVIIDGIINDVVYRERSARTLASARVALEALTRRVRAGAIYDNDHASVVRTGTWSAVVAADAPAFTRGKGRVTTTQGDKVTVTVTDQPKVELFVMAQDNTGYGAALPGRGGTGADFSVKLDGVTIQTGTTHDQMSLTDYGSNYKMCQQSIVVDNIPAGTHTIEITHTGPAGASLYFDSWQTPAATPPWVVLVGWGDVVAAGWTSYGRTRADALAFIAILDDIKALFTDGRVMHYEPDANGLWDPVNMTPQAQNYDYAHLNEVGAEHYAYEILRMLGERIP